MKIIITETQLKRMVNEINDTDLEMLKNMGAELVEEHPVGPYNLMLVQWESGEYEVAITTNDEPFTYPEAQRHKTMGDDIKNPRRLWSAVKDKLEEWLMIYGQLLIGSYNKSRVRKYHRLLNMIDMKTSEIYLASSHDYFVLYP